MSCLVTPYGIPVYCDPKQMSDMSIDLLLLTFAISLMAQNGKKYMINIYGKQVTHSTLFVNEVQNSLYK